jgi:hypothetical protein
MNAHISIYHNANYRKLSEIILSLIMTYDFFYFAEKQAYDVLRTSVVRITTTFY